MTKKEATVVCIKPIVKKTAKIRIIGDSPLIVHAWSEKAKKELLASQQGTKLKKDKKQAKNVYGEIAEAKHLAMQIMTQLCLDGYSISWSKADNAISLWMLDEDSRNHSNTFCMTDPLYWNTWIAKCVCLCRATGKEVPAFIVKKAGECW